MHKLMGELGLSPVSRSRVSAFPTSLGPKPWEFGQANREFAGLLGPPDPADRYFDS